MPECLLTCASFLADFVCHGHTFVSAMLRSPPPFRYSVSIPALIKCKVQIFLLQTYNFIHYFPFLREKRTVCKFYRSIVLPIVLLMKLHVTILITINHGKHMTKYLNIFLRATIFTFWKLFRGLGFYWSLIPFC